MTDATCTDFAADNWYLFKPSMFSRGGGLFQKENPASHRRRVSQNYFPEYSVDFHMFPPDLNPVEHVWEIVQTHSTNTI